ncbi:peptidase M61 [Sphingomonas sp. Leaf412]|uniref:M61 family metallopeptidase n=1 Tax=Sphingomonas sp. Leaf412 TaxID=1736370 RepID=UPI0006F54227|nr:PDZ domain-containing protein [Sphingomonas sp. Leaf412]KQT33393.1 peptidase M61 [Sphingomonas sp. Leaf412]
MRHIIALGLAAALPAAPVAAQAPAAPPVEYSVALADAAHHTARVTATWRALPPGPVRFQMARSSPGRYALHEFAKNVYAVSAVDGAGRALPVVRDDPYGWSVASHDGTVSVAYTLFGDRGDGTYAQIDATHAHLNAPATFLWAVGQDARAARVAFVGQPATWQVATQLKQEADGRWSAPDLPYLMDSPIEVGPHRRREWTLPGSGHRIRIALHAQVPDGEADAFADAAKRIVDEQVRMWGEAPPFDFGTYTFLADYLPWMAGDGMEHRNSTVISGSGKPSLSTLAHEFFHAWNVERLRPAELEPFDFTRANPTPSLWFAEGFTNYYGPLTTLRAKVGTFDEWLAGTSANLDQVLNAPARAVGGPREMSLRAPFADAAVSIDPAAPDIYLSYYPYGQAIALALDLTLRQRFRGVTLDDYMRLLWRTHGRAEKPYTQGDLRRALGTVTKDQAFADRFFADTIDGSGLPDLAPLLAQAGLVLRPARPGVGWIGGIGVEQAADGVVLSGYPARDTPLHRAGIEKGDRLIAIDGMAVGDAVAVRAALDAMRPGTSVRLRFLQRDAMRDGILTAIADPAVELVRVESTGRRPTARQRRFRAAWLGA